jgi:hypothetical protein
MQNSELQTMQNVKVSSQQGTPHQSLNRYTITQNSYKIYTYHYRHNCNH